jgi:uncharacterized protein (DUF885 family)
VTLTTDEVALTRPTTAEPGPLDEALYDLVEARFRRLIRDNPVVGTFVGIHTEDSRLGDGSRDAVLGELEADKRHLAAVESLDPDGLSESARLERDLELHNLRRSIFDTDTLRFWERRSYALDTVGDALFLLFARDFAPLAERLDSISGRLEALPAYLDQHRTRVRGQQVGIWQRLEIDAARDLPTFVDDVVAAANVLSDAGRRRLERAAQRARIAIDDYRGWLEASLAGATDGWAIGREDYDRLIELRAFDGLSTDEILDIGRRQLEESRAARAEAAREIDPSATEAEVVDRIKSDHPASFAEAIEAYRDAMFRARQHLIDRGIVTVPDDERLDVVRTPDYLQEVIPFAAYFEPPKFDPQPSGIYIVTPAVGNNPTAMREHNYSSISNTSIHEAYPGHHLQLAVASHHPSLTRLMVDAPEFVEGWGMYSELMMREHGFDDGPNFRLAMHTDAIWRACRIILDIQMHRGEIGVEEAVEFLASQTSFEEANARAEVYRYTYTPTYQLSYLLGRVLLLQLRADEQRRLGDAFDLKAFHDSLLRNGSLPISFHRRLLASRAG